MATTGVNTTEGVFSRSARVTAIAAITPWEEVVEEAKALRYLPAEVLKRTAVELTLMTSKRL